VRWLLGKDLRILGRSQLLLAILLVYPVAIALLIGLAISRGPGKPKVAIVDLAPAGQSIELAGKTLSVQRYANELFSEVDAVKVASRAAAVKQVSSGKALAAVVIPPDIVSKISSGTSQAQIEVIYNGDALQQSLAKASISSALAQANLALSRQIQGVAVHDIDVLLSGGELGILGAPPDLIGLRHIPSALRSIARRQSAPAQRRELERMASFASFAATNLGISKDVLKTVSQPIATRETLLHGKRTPLDSFAIVVAVAISLMFVCVLLASGSLALEREEHALERLTRGSGRRPALVSRTQLIVEKVSLAACCAFVLATAMLSAIAAFASLDWGRFGLWLIALGAGAIAFSALGVAIGALAREVRAASLLAFLLSLPLALLALVPSGAVSGGLYDAISAISFVFPYKPGLEALDGAVNGSSPGIGLPVLHALMLGLGFTALARLALRGQ
jgi:ABC-type transport system involved in cytochrome c biogenesis permease component